MSSYFQYTPAAYSPSMPSPTGRLDVTWSGGIGSLDYGRIPISGGGRRRRRASHKQTRRRSKTARRRTRRVRWTRNPCIS